MLPDEDPGFPRQLARGKAFVYIVPCRDDTLFKIGYTRDPLARWQTLHRRFFEFFDLERGVLIASDKVSEARRIERSLLATFIDYQAFAPLIVPASAAGHTEWFRGVLEEAVTGASDHAVCAGLTVHRPPAAWLRAVLIERTDRLFAWTRRMLDMIEFESHNASERHPNDADRYERGLGDALDAMESMDLDIAPHVPADVLQWHALRRGA